MKELKFTPSLPIPLQLAVTHHPYPAGHSTYLTVSPPFPLCKNDTVQLFQQMLSWDNTSKKWWLAIDSIVLLQVIQLMY